MASDSENGFPVPRISSRMRKPDSIRGLLPGRDGMPRSDLWTDGLICAFEYIRGHRRASVSGLGSRVRARTHMGIECGVRQALDDGENTASPRTIHRDNFLDTDDGANGRIDGMEHCYGADKFDGSHWVAIGWERVSALVQNLQEDASWSSVLLETVDEDELTVAEMATPYWERPAGPVWWCHLSAEHGFVKEWLGKAQWLHPAVSLALRDESKLISERMKHLLYEVPVRVAGGLLFELLGQSAGDPFVNEDDIPIVLRSWQAQHFLITVLHIKGPATAMNVLGIAEVQDLLAAGGYNVPRTVHEVIAHLASRLSRWDDRLFRKAIFGAADEIELMFMNRRNHEDLNLVSLILNQEIRRLSKQVIRVKWSLHAREEIVFELLQHLRGAVTRALLEGINKSTREMIGEQEAVRGRLFTIQDVMQSNVRAWLQDRSLKVTHNLTVFGGCGLVLSILTGLFGINVDGIPGSDGTPYAFGLFAAILAILGIILIAVGLLYLGLKNPISEEQVQLRKLELDELVKIFQHEAETHAQVGKALSRSNWTPTAKDLLPSDTNYMIIQ